MRQVLLAVALCVATFARATADSEVANGPVHEGVEVTIDVPPAYLRENDRGIPENGRPGAGLCVWASLQMSAWWQGIPELADLFEYMRTQPGGGWPARVEQVLKARAAGVGFVQYEGKDRETVIALIETALKTGRPVCITYGYGDFYRKRGANQISHMVLLVHFDEKWAAIIDNNDVANVTWMPREELLKRAAYPSGDTWVCVLIGTPPPPIPRNP